MKIWHLVTLNFVLYVSEKLMVLLRDGRTLIGYLRSVDQFANLVLHKTIERIHVGNQYGDIPRGIFIIRGENVVLMGEVVSRWWNFGPLNSASWRGSSCELRPGYRWFEPIDIGRVWIWDDEMSDLYYNYTEQVNDGKELYLMKLHSVLYKRSIPYSGLTEDIMI